MSNLHQLQLTYDQLQDRLILFLYTDNFQEYRFWLTRRTAKALCDVLGQILHANDDEVRLQQEENLVSEQIAKEKAQHQSTASKFANKMNVKPLGEEPLLISKISVSPGEKGRWRMRLESQTGQTLEIAGDTKIAVALSQMIHQTSTSADWQLQNSEKIKSRGPR